MGAPKSQLEQILVLLGLYLKSGKIAEAAGLLQRTKAKFLKEQAQSVWTFWQAQVLVAQGKLEEALKEAGREKDLRIRRNIQTLTLREISRRSGEWQPFVDHLEVCFEETQEGEFLFELCQLKAYHQEWPYVADRADALMQFVGTADVLRLAAFCAWNAQRTQQCLQLLREHRHLFPGNVLPNDLRRLEVFCHTRLGFLSQAVASVEELVRLEETVEHLLTLMELQLRKGDLKGLALTARRFTLREDVRAADLLRVARVVLFEDAGLAKEFWLRARTDVLDDPALLNEALALGFRLGLDTEMAPLIKRGQEFAAQGQGSFQLVALKDLPAMMQSRAEALADINQKYLRGEVFVHGVADQLRVPLAQVFHEFPEQNRRICNPQSQPILFIRHGGRPLEAYLATSGQSLRLHLDITALLLTADLGILDKVEQVFAPLRIAPEIPAALVQQQEMLAPHQPSRLAGYRHILQLLREGKLQPIAQEMDAPIESPELVGKMGEKWVAILETARLANGYVIDFLPLKSHNLEVEPVTLSEGDRGSVANCRALVERLRCDGYFSEVTYQKALGNLGGEGTAERLSVMPPTGAKIFLVANTASVLVEANLLESVCCYFQIFVDTALLEEARRAFEEEERRNEMRTWLGQLIAQVRAGLDGGKYECISLPDHLTLSESEKEQASNLNLLSLNLLSLMTLLRYPPRKGDAIWVDDRWVNSHAQRDSIPIIGIDEVLRTLLHCGALQENEYYDKLLRLRAANMRYVPLEPEEVLYHLKQAKVVNGTILETKELSILRRYMAACLLDKDYLQRPPLPEGIANSYGELAFVLGAVRAVNTAIAACWSDESINDETASARADWILKNLYTGWFGIRHLRSDPDPESDGLDLVGLEIGGLLSQGITLSSNERHTQGARVSQRRKFLDWVESKIIAQRFRADPDSAVAAGDTLKKLLADVFIRDYDKQEREVAARVVLQEFFLDLPKSIQDVIQSDPEVMARLGLTTFATVTIDQLCFEREKFLEALRNVVNGEEARLETYSSNGKFLLTVTPNGRGQRSFGLRDENGAVVQEFHDPLLGLLLDDLEARRTLLRSNRSWFDCRTNEFEKVVDEIVSAESLVDRIEKASRWRQASAAVFYAALEQQLRESHSVRKKDLLPPSGSSLLRHYRLDQRKGNEADFQGIWQEAGVALVTEEGIESALDRLGSLPVKLPNAIVEAFGKLSSEGQEQLCRRLNARWASPVCKLNLIDLTLRYARENPALLEIAGSAVIELFDEAKSDPQFRLFAALLNFVHDELSCWAEAAAWPAAIKLAIVWVHASRLQNLFTGAQAIPDELAQNFESSRSRISHEIFDRDLPLWNDILHPRRLNRIGFLVRGVASICAAHGPGLVEQVGVKELLLSTGFVKNDTNWVPRPELLRDPVLAGNLLGSFLGKDQAEILTPYIGPEIATMVASFVLRDVVKVAIQNLEGNPYRSGDWAKITWVVEGFSMYQDLDSQFRDLLKNVDFLALHNADSELAGVVLHLVAMQVTQLSDENLRLRGKDALLNIVRARAQSGNAVAGTKKDLLLLDTALALSVQPGNVRETTEGFARLLQEMLDMWPQLAQVFRPTLFRLVQELPVRQLHGLWPVVLRTRTYGNAKPASRGEITLS